MGRLAAAAFPNSVLRHELLEAPRWMRTRRALLRRWFNVLVLRYPYEICGACGRRVGLCTGSYWTTTNDLWERVNGRSEGVLCPPCFADQADAMGTPIHWEAVPGV